MAWWLIALARGAYLAARVVGWLLLAACVFRLLRIVVFDWWGL